MNLAEVSFMDHIIKQQIDEKRRRLNQRIQEAQAELAKLDQFEALGREIFSTEEASRGIPMLSDRVPRTGAIPIQPAGTLPDGSPAPRSEPISLPPPPVHIRAFGRVTKKETILATAAQILSDGRRRTSKELVEELKTHGVDIGGQDPVNNLAAYLSPDDRFESKRSEGGWGLVQGPHHAFADSHT